jgi:hypothetical protein
MGVLVCLNALKLLLGVDIKINMRTLEWHYDKKFKTWYACESVAWANDSIEIRKSDGFYRLTYADRWIGNFHFLRSAKTVADLIANG